MRFRLPNRLGDGYSPVIGMVPVGVWSMAVTNSVPAAWLRSRTTSAAVRFFTRSCRSGGGGGGGGMAPVVPDVLPLELVPLEPELLELELLELELVLAGGV